MALQDVYMESTEDENGVLISWSASDEQLYDNFTVLYCVGAQNILHGCNVCCRLLYKIARCYTLCRNICLFSIEM